VAWAKAHLEQSDGTRTDLGGSASWLGSGGVSYTRGPWVGSLLARYVGAQPLALSRGGGQTDAFVEANVRVLHRTRLFYPVTFYLDVQNLFDTQGELAASPVYAPATLPIEGRRALLSVEVRF
jgi:outer membrane receptor protein involved in Fe transport